MRLAEKEDRRMRERNAWPAITFTRFRAFSHKGSSHD